MRSADEGRGLATSRPETQVHSLYLLPGGKLIRSAYRLGRATVRFYASDLVLLDATARSRKPYKTRGFRLDGGEFGAKARSVEIEASRAGESLPGGDSSRSSGMSIERMAEPEPLARDMVDDHDGGDGVVHGARRSVSRVGLSRPALAESARVSDAAGRTRSPIAPTSGRRGGPRRTRQAMLKSPTGLLAPSAGPAARSSGRWLYGCDPRSCHRAHGGGGEEFIEPGALVVLGHAHRRRRPAPRGVDRVGERGEAVPLRRSASSFARSQPTGCRRSSCFSRGT